MSTIIHLHQLSKNFTSANHEVNALENINLEIREGEVFGIIGMSGAGKSTLVRCINFLESLQVGLFILLGKDLAQLTRPQLYKVRQSMGMIFQQFNLLMQRTALANVCFPLEITGVSKNETNQRAEELLHLVGLADKAGAYPAQLSGGQRQRVAIARALATNPKVLLCDEATSALDPATTRGVLSLLRDINKRLGITIVVITHEMSVIEEICQRVTILDDGQVAETGTVEDIFSRPKSQAARRLVYPDGQKIEQLNIGSRSIRIVFDGNSSFEPIIASMVLEFKHTVNILFADTKNIDGKAFGQIVIQLPEAEKVADRMIQYLRNKGLTVEEVDGVV